MNVIPAIDIRNGRCVRLLQGDFERESHYHDDPVRLAQDYAAMGFDRLHLVDLDGARLGTLQNRRLIRRLLRDVDLVVQLGGGLRDAGAIERWLEAGVDRCVVGSVAVVEPQRVRDWLGCFGPERILLALDVRIDDHGNPLLATHGWFATTDLSLWDCLDDYRASGLTDVLCTDIGRDGAMAGPNVPLYREFASRYPDLRLQASGGVRHIADLEALREAGVDSAITGRALLDGKITPAEVRSFLRVA